MIKLVAKQESLEIECSKRKETSTTMLSNVIAIKTSLQATLFMCMLEVNEKRFLETMLFSKLQ